MHVGVQLDDLTRVATDGVVVNLFEGVTVPGGATGAMDRALDGSLRKLIAGGDFKGKLGEVIVLAGGSGVAAMRVAMVGLGKQASFSVDRVRQASAEAARALRSRGSKRIATIVHGAGIGGLDVTEAACATIEGTLLGLYRIPKVTDEPNADDVDEVTVVEVDSAKFEAVRSGSERGRTLAEAACLARDLQNEPSNRLTPRALADRAREVAASTGLGAEVYDSAWMREQSMGALLGVAQGSAEPAQFIVLRYESSDGRSPIGLVGKGITFDSGGLSLKSPEAMELMKTDMSGGAVVIGAMAAIAQLRPNRSVVGIVPATENMPSATAQRPGDVVRTFSGKTIEVVNTDAEGRLVLADAIGYARSLGLTPIADVATLTGAIRMALGRIRTGVFSNHQPTLDMLVNAGAASGELLWPMPLDDEYFDLIKSDVADMKNSGGSDGGGAIAAAKLLEQFAGNIPWVHLDIAGTARSDRQHGYISRGGTGIGVRTLVRFVELVAAS